MKPEYLEQLADIADPDKLWRIRGMDQMDLPEDKRRQLDTGVALRRHASHVKRLRELLAEKRSLIITPLSENGSAIRAIETPPDHERLRQARASASTCEQQECLGCSSPTACARRYDRPDALGRVAENTSQRLTLRDAQKAMPLMFSRVNGLPMTAEENTDLDQFLKYAADMRTASLSDKEIDTMTAYAILAVDDPLEWGRLGPGNGDMVRKFGRALAKLLAGSRVSGKPGSRNV